MTNSSTLALRVALDCITEGTPATGQPEKFAKLSVAFPHSLEVASSKISPAYPIDSYNCFEFALGIVGRREVCLIPESTGGSTKCDGTFIASLVQSTFVPVTSAMDHDLVIYSDAHNYTHAGLVHGDRVLSKWGTGLLWLHGTLEVPASFGNTISYYRAVDPEEVLVKFLAFARQREGKSFIATILGS